MGKYHSSHHHAHLCCLVQVIIRPHSCLQALGFDIFFFFPNMTALVHGRDGCCFMWRRLWGGGVLLTWGHESQSRVVSCRQLAVDGSSVVCLQTHSCRVEAGLKRLKCLLLCLNFILSQLVNLK